MSRDLRLSIVLAAVDKATGVLKKINGGNKHLADTLRATRDQKKALDVQMGDIKHYRTMNIELRANERALKQKSQAAEQNRAALERLTASHTNIKASLAGAKANYNKLSTALINGKGDTAEFQRELEKAQIKLGSMRQAFERSASAIKKQRDGLRANESAITALNAKQTQLRDRLAPVNQRLTEQGVNLSRAGQHARALASQQNTLTSSIDKQKEALKSLNAQLERRRKLNSTLNAARNTGLKTAATGAVGAYAGQRAAQGMFSWLTPGIEYEKQMSELRSVTRLDAKDPMLEKLKAQARQLGATTSFSANDAGAGQTFLARAGFTPNAILASMQDVLDLALGQKLDLARTADIASNISSAFKIDPEAEGSMRRVGDVLATISNSANVQLEMLGDTMKYLGNASGLGVSLEESAVLAGLLGNIGIQGSQAGTTLRAMLNRLSAPAKAGQNAMKEIGLTVADATGNMRPITEILDDIFDKTKSLGNVKRAELLKHIFGEEAGSGMAELVEKQGTGQVRKLLDALKKSSGESSRAARIMEDNIDGDLKNLESAREELMISLTEMNNGPLRQTIQTFNSIIEKVTEWTKANPELTGSLIKWTAITLGVVTVLGILGFLVGNTIMGIAALGKVVLGLWPALKFVGTGLAWLGKLLLANPIILLITAIAASAFLIYKYWEPIKGFFQGVWTSVKEFFNQGISGISQALLNFSPLGILYNSFTKVLSLLGVELPEKFRSFGGLIVDGLIKGIRDGASRLYSSFKNLSGDAISAVKDTLGIRSPSRVFLQLGHDTIAGFNLGVMRAESQSVAQMGHWAGAVAGAGSITLDPSPLVRAPAFAAQTQPVTASSDKIEIHIHAREGQNALDISREVERILQERDRQKSARNRASFRDTF